MGLKRKKNPPRSSLVEMLAQSNARLLRKVTRLESEIAHARHLAYHDPLTGLPNRALLFDRLGQAMQRALRHRMAVGLLLLDLDSFKDVNDRLGHNAGDRILQLVAERLTDSIRGGDTACRYGGDEFVILLPEIGGADELDAVARKIRASLLQPHRVGAESVIVSASFGTALFDEGSASCADLIGAADLAMYRAKSRSVAGVDEGCVAA